MKYKVIGWTSYDNNDVPEYKGNIDFDERAAIIEEIRKHKYLFTGWHHQEYDNCAPVLNDGMKRLFSQRGWGSIMAEAYNYTGDYDYANFTFYQSIDSKSIRIPTDSFDNEEFLRETVKTSSYTIEISKELFELNNNSDTIYLENLDELKFINRYDILTLTCENESFSVVVKEVDRNKTASKFKYPELISTKFKIIIKHRPVTIKDLNRKELAITEADAYTEYTNVMYFDYDYDTLFQLFNSFNLDLFLTYLDKYSVIGLKRFVNEYIEDDFNVDILTKILLELAEFDFHKEIAYKTINKNPNVLIQFVYNYFDSDEISDDDIIAAASKLKSNALYYLNILEAAINLKPHNKALCKKYYNATKNMNDSGLPLMFLIEDHKSLNKEHKVLVDLEDYKKMNIHDVLLFAELLSYPDNNVSNDSKYPFRAPSFFESNLCNIAEGLLKYKEFIITSYNEDIIPQILRYGVELRCSHLDIEYEGYIKSAEYIYALDALTGFKYNLKGYAFDKYNKIHDELIKYLNRIY